MREFKFRVWCKGKSDNPNFNKQKWFDINDVILNKYFPRLFNQNDDNFVIQQYTGLKDRDGKDIYEGDIVMSIYNKEIALVDFNNENYGKVLGWNLLSIAFFDPKQDRFVNTEQVPVEYYYGKSPGENWVIIGNIFQNPELLNGSNS
jgi:uncharacterized phage protein (TIGR01671 family)